MNKEQMLTLLADFCDAKGAPGFEYEVADVAKKYGQKYGRVSQDKMLNVYVERSGNRDRLDQARSRRLRIQLDAHLDEVAFMVQAILPNGCMTIMPLGGWVASNVPAHKMLLRRPDGTYITGILSSKPPHFMTAEERARALNLSDVVLDVGASSAAELIDLGIEIGQPLIPATKFEYDQLRDLMIAKAFDCRSGCASIINTLDLLDGQDLDLDVFAAFATQEEVGTRGAKVTSNRIQPDLAIVFEGCPADDTFGQIELAQTKLGYGPMLRHLDSGMITHPGFQAYALAKAKELGLPVQRAVRSGGSTNGAPIHLSGQGVPTIVIGIPVRYIHTSYGLATYADHEHAAKLAAGIIKSMSAEVFASL